MPSGQSWEFRQVGPPNKILTLSGQAAPHGRLRREAVANTRLELRDNETFYGGKRSPTRQVFGDKQTPMVLRGRWSDQFLGVGGTQKQIVSFKNFVADQQLATVKWGSIVAYIGLPFAFEEWWETDSDARWEFTIKLDEDMSLDALSQPVVPIKSPADSINALTADFAKFLATVRVNAIAEDFSPSFLDLIDDAISKFNSASATLINAAKSVQDFESALASDIKRLRGGINQFRTAALVIQNTVDSIPIDSQLFNRSAETDTKYFAYTTQSAIALFDMLAILADLDIRAERSQRGTARVTTKAQDGDTWESISNRVYYSPDGAQRLRDANGVRYGSLPTPGFDYVVPQGF